MNYLPLQFTIIIGDFIPKKLLKIVTLAEHTTKSFRTITNEASVP